MVAKIEDEGCVLKKLTWFKSQDIPEATGNQISLQCRPAHSDKYNEHSITVTVPEYFIGYNLEPLHYGPSVVYLNAQDFRFYEQTLSNPALTVWCLVRSDEINGYVKRRLWEASFARNICMRFMATYRFDLLASKGGLEDILYDGKKVELPDIVLVRTGASIDYFGLAVVRQIEKMGVTVLNGCQSIEISRDKLQTMQVMAAHGLPIAKTLLAKFPINFNVVESHFKYPIIVKKSSGSQGKGILLVKDHENLEDLVDLRVLVVGGRVVASMMRIASKGFKANVHQGGTVRTVKISPQVEWLVLEATRLTGLDIAGIDLLIDKDTYKICEINSSPGFEGLEEATGFDVASATLAYIKMRMGLYRFPHLKNSGKIHTPLNVTVEEDHRQPSDSL